MSERNGDIDASPGSDPSGYWVRQPDGSWRGQQGEWAPGQPEAAPTLSSEEYWSRQPDGSWLGQRGERVPAAPGDQQTQTQGRQVGSQSFSWAPPDAQHQTSAPTSTPTFGAPNYGAPSYGAPPSGAPPVYGAPGTHGSWGAPSGGGGWGGAGAPSVTGASSLRGSVDDAKRPFWRKPAALAGMIGGLLFVVLVAALAVRAGSNADDEEVTASDTSSTTPRTTETAPTAAPTTAAPTPTTPAGSTPTTSSTGIRTELPPILGAPDIRVQRFQGEGSRVLDIEKPADAPALVAMEGNAASRYFSVTALGAGNEQKDLLASAAEPYRGVRLLDADFRAGSLRLEVEATGPWTIELRPVSTARKVAVPGQFQGNGDDVLLIEGTPDLARFSGNKGGRDGRGAGFFGARAYGGQYPDILFSASDPYEGQVTVPTETKVVEVEATGPWSVTFE